MQNWNFIIMPLIGALIGWITNVVAIKMLFWPKKPIGIPGLPWKFIGLLPKRHEELAVSIGQTVERDLLPMDDIIDYIENSGFQEHLVETIVFHVDKRIQNKLPRLIPENLKELLRDYVKEIISKESYAVINQVASGALDKVKSELSLGQMVEAKVRSLDLEQLEYMIKEISSTELKHIEYLGAVLGLLIGCGQALLLFLSS